MAMGRGEGVSDGRCLGSAQVVDTLHNRVYIGCLTREQVQDVHRRVAREEAASRPGPPPARAALPRQHVSALRARLDPRQAGAWDGGRGLRVRRNDSLFKLCPRPLVAPADQWSSPRNRQGGGAVCR